MKNKIIQGDCLDILKTIPDESVDSIVTDPPYELGFMGKSWDNTGIAYNVDMWKECLRVLKPGGHLLAFSGTRTYHRMAVAIEDAGFEVRDMIEWVYGCLSEDTEILTESGYKPLHKLTQYDKIGVYDITNNIYKWERPQRYSVYKVHQDTAYRIKSDYTDQIVSRNHRCLVEREGKLVFIQAEELKEVEYMPTLSEDFYSLQEGHRKLLLKELLWKGKRLAQKLFSKWTRKEVSSERIEVRKEPSLERWSNLLEETRKLQADKICEVSEGVFTDGEKRWICNGTSFDSGSILGDMFRENPSSSSYQSRPTGQPTGKPDVISVKQGTQIIRRATVTKIEYSGIIFCPTVSTGAFVARRNGQVFITGNSGFPKSLNIGKAVDKLQGNERKVIEEKEQRNPYIGSDNLQFRDAPDYTGKKEIITKGTSEWEGWGTALKPAHEPICMARKPLAEKTVAENCLKYGTGGINIDESRVAANWKEERPESWFNSGKSKSGNPTYDGNLKSLTESTVGERLNDAGRFPANLIHDNSEEVRECFPETKSQGHWSKTKTTGFGEFGNGSSEYLGVGEKDKEGGNASRFFKSIPSGRFPANLIHDNSEEVRECFPETKSGGTNGKKVGNKNCWLGVDKEYDMNELAPNSGNASRFFKSIIYEAKSPKSERLICGFNCVKLEEWTQQKKTKQEEENTVAEVSLVKVILGLVAPSLSIGGYGNKQTEAYPTDFISTIRTAISKITELKTWNLLIQQPTNDSILAVIKEVMAGINYAEFAVSEKELIKRIGIFQKKITHSTEDVKNATYQSLLKISKPDAWQDAYSHHPTHKPLALMKYLIQMITPPNGIVLDPFAGSGSTLIAAKQNGFNFIGIEMETDYIKIAEARLQALPNTLF